MNGEHVLVNNVMLYYKCVDLICVCTNYVNYLLYSVHTLSVGLLCHELASVCTMHVLQSCIVIVMLQSVS
jgi:hypothetical protein